MLKFLNSVQTEFPDRTRKSRQMLILSILNIRLLNVYVLRSDEFYQKLDKLPSLEKEVNTDL